MANINYDEIERTLAKARKRSWLRFLLFLGFILALWIATYVITKGQFTLFTKKIAVTDTLVIDQSAALAGRDSTITDLKKLAKVLKDSLSKMAAYVPEPVRRKWEERPVDEQNDQVNKLQMQILKRDSSQVRRDNIIRIRREQAYPNAMQQMVIPTKKQ
jgi:ABC-type anion transport system duplicated permease subunit